MVLNLFQSATSSCKQPLENEAQTQAVTQWLFNHKFVRKKSNPWHLPRAKDSWICWLCVLLKSDTFVPWCPLHILQSRVLFRPSRGNFNTLNAMQMGRVPLWKQRGAFGELLQNSLSSLSFLKFDHKSLNPRHSARCHARREIYLCRLCRERSKGRFAASS